MKRFAVLFSLLVFFSVSGCDRTRYYESGTFSGRSFDDPTGYGVVTIQIEENKIVDCQYEMRLRNGNIKDEEYGKVNGDMRNRSYYEKAQFAVKSAPLYIKQLLEVQKPSKVDAISGATIAYNQFLDAVDAALDQAKAKKKE